MVTSATSLTSSGLRDWLVQRVSAVIIGLYVLCILGYLLAHPHIDFHCWKRLFAHLSMRIFTLLTLFSILVHTWIGMWTVFTDYIRLSALRLILTTLLILLLFGYLFWGFEIVFSVI